MSYVGTKLIQHMIYNYMIMILIYYINYISAQFIIFRRSSLNSNNFTGEIVTSSELINYFTSA